MPSVERSAARRLVVPLAVAAAVVAAATGCGGDERPDPANWGAAWRVEQDRVPSAGELLAGGRDLCDELVGELRGSRDRLSPTPSAALDAATSDWVDHAETIVFECPDDPIELEEQYEQLLVLEAAVDAGLGEASG